MRTQMHREMLSPGPRAPLERLAAATAVADPGTTAAPGASISSSEVVRSGHLRTPTARSRSPNRTDARVCARSQSTKEKHDE